MRKGGLPAPIVSAAEKMILDLRDLEPSMSSTYR